tara:strand:+ start:3223 stop:3912 length:690 start_codon:yes stop_codon:yes gene_type:complete
MLIKEQIEWKVSHWVYHKEPASRGRRVALASPPRNKEEPRRRERREYVVKRMLPIIKDKILHPEHGRYVRVWRHRANVTIPGKSPLAKANGRQLMAGFTERRAQHNTLTPDLMISSQQYFSDTGYRDTNTNPEQQWAELTCLEYWSKEEFDRLLQTMEAADKALPKAEKVKGGITEAYVKEHISYLSGLTLDFVDEHDNMYFGVFKDSKQEYGVDGQPMVIREREAVQE